MVFHTIRIAPPRQKIYQRLGYHRQVTQVSPQQQALTDNQIDEALSLIHLQGVTRRVPIVDRQKRVTILENQVRLESENLSVFLRDCDEAFFMGATVGEEIMAAIRHDLATEAVTRAVVFDATASEMADGALDWLMDYTRQTLLREGKVLLKRRYSAGYGDFALENQQLFHVLLDLGKISVRITEQSILIPEKSVTAVTGIRKSALTVEPHL